MKLNILSRLTVKNTNLLRYGLLFIIGVIFGSIGMFYKSFDITRHVLERHESYLWSESEKTYVPFHINRSNYSSSKPVLFVLILTYMRSGSSFTGDVIQHHPDAFYAFEPLISLVHDKSVTYLNGTKRNFTDDRDLDKERVKTLERWYNCDLYNIDLNTLKHLFMSFGIHTNEFYECVGKRKLKADILNCLPKLVKACKNSKIRVIKTIRVNIKDIPDYFQNFPNFKLIHLIRDPRGILNSRRKLDSKKYVGPKMVAHARYLCHEMAGDMNDTFQLIKKYPKRVTVLQYEDLAENPYSTAARLYTFLNIDISLEIYGYIFCITSAGVVKERAYGIARSDSKSTANKWKNSLKYSDIKNIDLECVKKYPQLGYLPINNSSSLNSTGTLSTRINILQEIKHFIT